jgi:hypothetical protein
MKSTSLLKNADHTIMQRDSQYGDFRPLYERAATIANATLGTSLNVYDILMIMNAVKMARMGGVADQVDNYLDAVNYLALAQEVRFPPNSVEDIIDDGAAEMARRFSPASMAS